MENIQKHKAFLYKKITIPEQFQIRETVEEEELTYGGDIRIGDLTGSGRPGFIVYRCKDNGLKPGFIGAFTFEGEPLWQEGSDGMQPLRPGPVAVYDINGDGKDEIITFFLSGNYRENKDEPSDSLHNVIIQIRDGATGTVLKENHPSIFDTVSGSGSNWYHQRILIANFRGTPFPKDFAVKLGTLVVAFDDNLEILWHYESKWSEYKHCPAYIPSVGDIDGDGCDEINGGYFLLDQDGSVMWEHPFARNMDSVAIAPWDDDKMRAVCSGYGMVIGADGEIVLCLGRDIVPHGQEMRCARFTKAARKNQMVIRRYGHKPDVILVDNDGSIIRKFAVNSSPNETGMTDIYWNGPDNPALLYNGGMLWDAGEGREYLRFPGLPDPSGPARMGWYHCIPADVCGDFREEAVLYNPWDSHIYIYTQDPLKSDSAEPHYRATPRQYNVRLMD